jgi:hypothetical protein
MSIPDRRHVRPAGRYRTWLVGALLAAPGLLAAQGSIGLTAGATSSVVVAPGAKLTVPVLVDLSAAPSASLASLTSSVTWGSARLTLDSLRPGTFGTLTANTANASAGSSSFSLFNSTGASTSFTVANLYFTASNTAGGTQVTLQPSAAGNENGTSILSQLRPRGLDVCIGVTTKWGDANGDAAVNIVDAQQIARYTVGLPVLDQAALLASGDVNGDNNVDIIDAQQIARSSVELSASPRIGQPQIVSPAVNTLTLTPATATALIGQSVQLTATPKDASNNSVAGCAAVTWTSSNPSFATVNASGLVTGVQNGTVTITARAGGQTATAIVTSGSGSASLLAITTAPSTSLQYGVPFAVQPVIQLRDVNNVPIGTAGVPVTATITFTNGGGGTLGGTTTVLTASDGSAAFTDLKITGQAYGYRLTYSSPGLTSVTGAVQGLNAGPAAIIAYNAGDNASALAGRTVSGQSVKVTDASGNAAAGVVVTFAVTSGGGSITGATPTTNASGIATAGVWTLGATPGTNTLTATVAGLSGSPVTFTATGTTPFQLASLGTGEFGCGIASNGDGYCGVVGGATPTLIPGGHSWTALSTRSGHTCGIVSGGAAYCWGTNSSGQLGDGTTTARAIPALVNGGLTFTSIAAGDDHSCGVTTTGVAYCWGNNTAHQLGDGTAVSHPDPTAVAGGLTFSSVSAGVDWSCGIVSGGAAYCWGANIPPNGATPVLVAGGLNFASLSVGVYHACGVTTSGAGYCWGFVDGDNCCNPVVYPPRLIPGGLTFTKIAVGLFRQCAIATSGSAYCWPSSRSVDFNTGAVTLAQPVIIPGGMTFIDIGDYGGIASTHGTYTWSPGNLTPVPVLSP